MCDKNYNFFDTKKIEDYIVVLKNIVPHNICDNVVKEYEHSEDFCPALISKGFDKEIRSCQNLNISDLNIINKNHEKRIYLDEKIYFIVAQAVSQYQKLFSYCDNFSGDSGYMFLKYEIGDHYTYHVDDGNLNPRKVSISLVLNDNFEGGEFSFFHGKKIYNLNKGDGIMFPSSFMYPHAVLPIKSGVRYSIVTWLI